MCQFHFYSTWIKILVGGHLTNKTRQFSTLQVFHIKFLVTFCLNYAQQYCLGYFYASGEYCKRRVGSYRKKKNFCMYFCIIFLWNSNSSKKKNPKILKICALIQRGNRELCLSQLFCLLAFSHLLKCSAHMLVFPLAQHVRGFAQFNPYYEVCWTRQVNREMLDVTFSMWMLWLVWFSCSLVMEDYTLQDGDRLTFSGFCASWWHRLLCQHSQQLCGLLEEIDYFAMFKMLSKCLKWCSI